MTEDEQMVARTCWRDVSAARRIASRLVPWKPLKPFKVVAIRNDGTMPVEFWDNDRFEVTVRRFASGAPLGNGPYIRLGIAAFDGGAHHDWRDLQAIKNMLCGQEWEAIELYPAESRLVDPSNYYVLYVMPYRLPFGLEVGRKVLTPEECLAPQRGWAKI